MHENDIAIRTNGISKIYRIGVKQEMHDNFLRAFLHFIKSPFTNFRKYRSLYRFDDVLANSENSLDESVSNILWALKGISFDVKKGERVGIIGRNGAGKSTLLKILSRITAPTQGDIEIRGRISSLLEVGTGFHPDLTGRENVYLNGTVLGMRKLEVDQKFEQIVEFAGMGKFIDTPVKRYSSGMQVRLAFSVAAHLEPEILIVDEVLAVGDARFQKKCLDKMEDVGKEGRTVIFVSHNMAAITRLCERTLLIDEGTLVADGSSHSVVSNYLQSELGTVAARKWQDEAKAPGNAIAKLKSARVLNKNSAVAETIDIREPVIIEMTYDVYQGRHKLLPHFCLTNAKNECIFVTVDQDTQWRQKQRPSGQYTNRVIVPGNLLAEGMVTVDCSLMTLDPDGLIFDANSAVSFNVVDSMDGNSARGDYSKDMPGIVRPLLTWETDFEGG
jgi:lipopolysaccharide transport system ATP-binding protein